jgi:arylsulfatase A-like enzyme
MNLRRPLPVLLLGAALVLAAPVDGASPGGTRPNVLFIAFDDLSDWIQPLDPSSPIAMPNLERLASRGVLFRRAYCAAPECNHSRTALLSGRRPTTSGVYANASDWKAVMPEVVMLPRYFRDHGYASVGAGKIYHHVHRHFHDEASFADYLPFLTDQLPAEKLNGLTRARTPDGRWEPLAPTFDWGPTVEGEAAMLDTRSADYAVRFLARPAERPFFLAVGFFRPHLPYFSPPRFLARYPAATMPLPPVLADDLADVPAGAHALMERWTRMFRGIQQAPEPTAKWREAVATYAAGATYADEQLGRVLDALDASPHRDNTIIVAWSDHGYHLGEKDHWTKFVLWEKANRVPLVIVAPGVARPGGKSDRPVSLVDLYPTLVELCGLPARPDLDGLSLVPLLRDPAAARQRPALMTEMPGNHAVRSDRWRYIRYADGGEELYDHSADPHEWTNLARDARFHDVLAEHRRWLPDREAPLAPNFP